MNGQDIAGLFAAGQSALRSGDTRLAQRRYEEVLALAPDHAGAANALGMVALRHGAARDAEQWFVRAAGADTASPDLWLNVATARRQQNDDAGERDALLRVLDRDQRHMGGLVRLAQFHERRGEAASATRHWAAVVSLADGVVDPAPAFADILSHAHAYLAKGNAALSDAVDSAVGEALSGLSHSERRRFDACLSTVLGRRRIYSNECHGLHFPFLPADEFFDREHFPWLSQIEAQVDVIRAELETGLSADAALVRPYVTLAPGSPQGKWSPLDRSLEWGAIHLWRDGVRDDAVCARFPRTAAAIADLPLSDVPGRTPTVFFSLLKPGAHLPAHTGVSNIRTIVHLPLIVPEGCTFRVGGETRAWEEGVAWAFDDTIDHEAWNRSDRPRAILIFDVWNPYLTPVERDLIRRFYTVAADMTDDALALGD